jgi:hypothetical protein
MSYDFNADDILKMAEQIERNGALFYRESAEKVTDHAAKEFLLGFASMEDEHERTFASIRSQLSQKEKESTVFDPQGEAAGYLKALADTRVFFEKEMPLDSLEDILKEAITAEKDSRIGQRLEATGSLTLRIKDGALFFLLRQLRSNGSEGPFMLIFHGSKTEQEFFGYRIRNLVSGRSIKQSPVSFYLFRHLQNVISIEVVTHWFPFLYSSSLQSLSHSGQALFISSLNLSIHSPHSSWTLGMSPYFSRISSALRTVA